MYLLEVLDGFLMINVLYVIKYELINVSIIFIDIIFLLKMDIYMNKNKI